MGKNFNLCHLNLKKKNGNIRIEKGKKYLTNAHTISNRNYSLALF